jgi:hypothetical protein
MPGAEIKIETGNLHAIPASRRTGGEVSGEPPARRPAENGNAASRSGAANAAAWIQHQSISAKRRNKSNPWFKRGTLFRSAVDVLRRAEAMTVREIAQALIADKAVPATRKQFLDLTAVNPRLVSEAEWRGGCW